MPKKTEQLMFIKRFNLLLNERNISTYELSEQLSDFSYTQILQWSTGELFPEKEELEKIAEYFNVDTDFLLNTTKGNKVQKKTGDSETRKNFAINLKRLIEKTEKSQKQIAKETDILETSISQWCSCISFPNEKALKKLSVYFGVPVSDLIEENIKLNERQESTYHKLLKLIGKVPEQNKILFYDALTAFVKTIK